MKRALLLAASALLASSCGSSKPAASAADIAPRSTTLFVSGTPDAAESRALRLLPEGATLEFRAAAARSLAGARAATQVALIGTQAVAFARPADRKRLDRQLDRVGLAHVRFRGWTMFSRSAAALELVRHAKRVLASAPWYHEPTGDATYVRRVSTVTITRDRGRIRVERSEHGGVDRDQPLAARIPADAIAAASFRPADLMALPFAAQLQAGLGLRLADVAGAAPGGGVLFARPGTPVPPVTLLGTGGTLASARRIVRSLDPNAPASVPSTLDGVPVADVPLGAADILYGRHGDILAVTLDPGLRLTSAVTPLAPPGLPRRTAAWAYLDVEHGLPGLEALAALAGQSLSPRFVAQVVPFRSVLAYRQAGRLAVSVEPR
ncbi:MAG: hypothetical protein H0X39_15350 [Actinobacteria bacterium]|nr:hypothetical protein [Actinomycetota bacterium]